MLNTIRMYASCHIQPSEMQTFWLIYLQNQMSNSYFYDFLSIDKEPALLQYLMDLNKMSLPGREGPRGLFDFVSPNDITTAVSMVMHLCHF